MALIEHRLSNGQDFKLSTTTGTVLSTAEKRALVISQRATTVLPNGSVVAGGMRTSTRASQEVWIRSDDGKEEAIALDGFTIPLREGHRIIVVSGAPAGVEELTAFGVMNQATEQVEASVAPIRAASTAWKLDVGANASVVRWSLTPAALFGGLIFLNTRTDPDRLMFTLTGAIFAAAVGVSAWLNFGRGIGVEARGEALLSEVRELGLSTLRSVDSN